MCNLVSSDLTAQESVPSWRVPLLAVADDLFHVLGKVRVEDRTLTGLQFVSFR